MTVLLLIQKSLFRMRRVNVSMLFSLFGIAVGVFSVVSILGIMNGMQSLLVDKLELVETYDYRGEVEIEDATDLEDYVSVLSQIQGVTYVVPFIDQFAVLESEGRSELINVRAIDFDLFFRDERLFESMKLLNNKYPQYAYEEENSTILGWDLARKLQIFYEDIVHITFPGDQQGFIPVQLELKISDTFTVAKKYDKAWLFLPLKYFLEETDGNSSLVNFGIRSEKNNKTKNNIETVLGNVSTWEENNSAFFVALKTEKVMLALMLVAIFVVIILHFRFSMLRRVNSKREEIVALRTMGESSLGIQLWFIGETFIIGILACLLGSALGLLFLQNFHYISNFLISTFQIYLDVHIQRVVELNILNALYTGLLTVVLLMLTSISIVKAVNKISPLQVIRYE